MTRCNVKPEYWTRSFKFVAVGSQIATTSRISMAYWGFPQDEGHMPSCRITHTMAVRVGRMESVDAAVRDYKAKHRKATWDEIFGNVPNHYLDKDSMRDMHNKLAKKRKAAR